MNCKVKKINGGFVIAKQCIHNHRNPVFKLNSSCLKLFFSAKTREDEQVVNKQYIQLRHVLEHQRVEKRSNRAQAVWLVNENLAQVTKVTKNLLKSFGTQNKNGIFLNPVEMTFLIEANRLELISINNQVSIENAYRILLETTNLKRYRVYKTLVILGYKLSRVKRIECILSSAAQQSDSKKRSQNGTRYHKKRKMEPSFNDTNCSDIDISSGIPCTSSEGELSEAQYVENILKRARQIMPRDSISKSSVLKPDYYVYSPFKTMEQQSEISLFICEEDRLDFGCSSKNTSNVYAMCTEDVAFYSFNDVYLPFI
ncbi:uncharacterized protein LOC109539425 isoform X1 [Dendroctonus ponderosae]|uniref:uncharacterized protein LOC109539425 isoform X1 n=1 Tax=Dendroctonus ponderosae TaxID=77166 RepID=UPI002034FC38|nr:uncharacterized protein LOC109539425 isoform X1 [Dendroctonus ponderosae]